MFQLIIQNTNNDNWEFNDKYENFNELIERVSKTLKAWEKEIAETTIYNLKPFHIRIYNLTETPNQSNVLQEKRS